MADRMTPQQRHFCMSRIRSRDTQPELIVRRFLWRHNFHYRLQDPALPGKPDIVLRKWNTVIFVNGCFWHGHDCNCARLPKTNQTFWTNKIERNQQRDKQNIKLLTCMGFNVITIWECELKKNRRKATLQSLLVTLSNIIINQYTIKPYALPDSDLPSSIKPKLTDSESDTNLPLAAEPTTKYK